MRDKLIRIAVNALLGAISSAITVYLGGSIVDATGVGSATSATVGDTVTRVVMDVVEALA